jgi:hypothetical protein
MPLMYAENTLQMEWCLDCHRNPAKNLRPTGEVYNNAWEKPSEDKPVWCAVGGKGDELMSGVPTAQGVNCTTKEPSVEMASLNLSASGVLPSAQYKKFTSQDELGHFLVDHYKIRTPKDLTSCEVCHR